MNTYNFDTYAYVVYTSLSQPAFKAAREKAKQQQLKTIEYVEDYLRSIDESACEGFDSMNALIEAAQLTAKQLENSLI